MILPLAGLAGIAFVGLGAIGIARAWDPLPLRDMWDGYLGFWYRLTSGDLEAMWAQYNEHRLILSRIAFVIDLAVFRGAGWFLIVANGAAALSIAAIFVSSLIVRLREGLHQTGTRLGLGLLSAIIVGLTTSWVQNQNLLWGFQIQFFLGVLLPLASFVAVAAARRDAPHPTARFVAATLLSVASIGTIAAGLLAPFIAAALATALRESRRRIGVLVLAAIACAGVYLNGYTSPPNASDPLHWLGHPISVAEYVLIYLGGPVSNATQSPTAGMVSAVALLAVLAWSGYRWVRGRDSSRIAAAMLAFGVYILIGAFVTALGRLDFGTSQATAGRYSTPVLAAWSAAVVLIAPTVQTALAHHRRPVAAVLGGVLIGLLAAQLDVFADVRQLHFGRQYATLAIALGVPDQRAIAAVYPLPVRAVELGQLAIRDGLTVLSQSPYRDLSGEIGRRTPTTTRVWCDGRINARAIVPGSRFVRLDGNLIANASLGAGDGVVRLLDARNTIVGFAVVRELGDDTSLPAPLVAYVAADAGRRLRFAGVAASCSTMLSVP